MEKYSLSGLYYKYKKTTDQEIKRFLDSVLIVSLKNKKYYALTKNAIGKIKNDPRHVSLTFDATATYKKSIQGLVEYKTITFLVKSSSRFFLKPDIGEVFDQIDYRDKMYLDGRTINAKPIKALCINEDYETLPDTQGEHFLMTATLFK